VGHDAAARAGETGCLVGLKKPFSELNKNAVKGKKSENTHGEGMYSASQVQRAISDSSLLTQ